MGQTGTAPKFITADELAERLERGESTTVLDVRGDPSFGVEAHAVRPLHIPADRLVEYADTVADGLIGPAVVTCNRGMTAQAAAQALAAAGGDALILEGGLRSWLQVLRSHPVDLGVDGLSVRQVQRPGRGCLSYVLASRGEAMVVDPVVDPDYYLELAAEMGAEIAHVFDTHLHADHISVARELANRVGATHWIPSKTVDRGIDYDTSFKTLGDGDEIHLGEVRLTGVSLPGHTTDMTGVDVAGVALVTGDSLFADSLARPDLERGDPEGASKMAQILHSTIHGRILSQDDSTIMLPGHTHPGLLTEAVAPNLGQVREAVGELAIEDPGEFADRVAAALPPRPSNYEAIIELNAGRGKFDPELEQGGNSCATVAPAGP